MPNYWTANSAAPQCQDAIAGSDDSIIPALTERETTHFSSRCLICGGPETWITKGHPALRSKILLGCWGSKTILLKTTAASSANSTSQAMPCTPSVHVDLWAFLSKDSTHLTPTIVRFPKGWSLTCTAETLAVDSLPLAMSWHCHASGGFFRVFSQLAAGHCACSLQLGIVYVADCGRSRAGTACRYRRQCKAGLCLTRASEI